MKHSSTRRWRLLVALLALFALLAASCGDDDSDDTSGDDTADDTTDDDTTEDDTTDDDMAEDDMADDDMADDDMGDDMSTLIKIAVVSPSATNDLAFSQSMADGLAELEAQGWTLEVAYSDGLFVVEDGAAALRDYAEQGYDLVIAHGSQYGGSLEQIAPDFPEVSFAWGTATDTLGLDNVFAYTSAADEGGYVLGAMAAAYTTEPIGVVGPIEAGDAALYIDGFVAGAAAEGNSDVTVNYIGSFSDVALASEAAQAFVTAEVGAMTGTAQMVVGAVGVAAEAEIPWFGTQADQTQLSPDYVVASQVYHWDVILNEMLHEIAGGTLGGEVYEIDLANGGLSIVYNDGFELPDEIKTIGDDATAAIIAGEVTTGVGG